VLEEDMSGFDYFVFGRRPKRFWNEFSLYSFKQ